MRAPDEGNDPSTVADPEKRMEDDVVGEARWPMAGAVLAAMVLTLLLPDEVQLGPIWVLPLIEGVLLVAVIAADPVTISRRSRELRALSIALVFVLVLGSLWATVQLIDDLIHGGPETNSASDLLEAGTIVWVSNNIAFALLYWELDGGGAAARAHERPTYADLAFPQQLNPRDRASRLATPVHRLPLPGFHQRDCVQPDRRHAAGALGQDRDGGAVRHLARHPRAGHRTGRERVHLVLPGLQRTNPDLPPRRKKKSLRPS